jgi:hypothetical protein
MARVGASLVLVVMLVGCSSVIQKEGPLDAGTAVISCEELLPGPPGTPVSVPGAWPWPKDEIWADAQPLVDNEGHVLQRVRKQLQTTLNVWSPGGALLASTTVPVEQTPQFSLASGFLAVEEQDAPPPPSFDLLLFEPDGGTHATPTKEGSPLVVQDPRGGVVALSLTSGELTAFDDLLQARWSVQIPIPLGLAFLREHTTVGVDVSGHVLILFWTMDIPGPLGGVWVTADGEVRPSFVAGVADPSELLSLEPDARGGLFVRTTRCTGHCVKGWSGRFGALSTAHEQPPGWRVDLVGLDTRLIRGGAGYAVIGGEPTCLSGCPVPPFAMCQIAVFAVDGTRCGVIDFADALRGAPVPPFGRSAVLANAGSGRPECSASLDVGLDGTVTAVVSAQLVQVPCDPESTFCADIVDWFPAYFR